MCLPAAAAPHDVRVIWSGRTDLRQVALTFDDGPSLENTSGVLDLLAEADAHATFFLVGERIEASGERGAALVRRMIAEGHEVGNHSFTHSNIAKLSAASLTREVERTQNLLERIAGVRAHFFRPPGGAIDFATVRSLAATDIDGIVMWSIDPADWSTPGKEKILERVAAAATPGAIILLHDIHRETLLALPLLIDLLQAKGLQLVTISELMQ